MKKRALFVVAVLWATSLVGVGLWAQTGKTTGRTLVEGQPFGPVLSGEDFGFQPIYMPNDTTGVINGRLVVRVNGQWRLAMEPPRR
jgi:hypothetical protein